MKEKTMETMTVEERAAHIIDMFHRITVHHTLWFREAAVSYTHLTLPTKA